MQQCSLNPWWEVIAHSCDSQAEQQEWEEQRERYLPKVLAARAVQRAVAKVEAEERTAAGQGQAATAAETEGQPVPPPAQPLPASHAQQQQLHGEQAAERHPPGPANLQLLNRQLAARQREDQRQQQWPVPQQQSLMLNRPQQPFQQQSLASDQRQQVVPPTPEVPQLPEPTALGLEGQEEAALQAAAGSSAASPWLGFAAALPVAVEPPPQQSPLRHFTGGVRFTPEEPSLLEQQVP